MLIWRRYRVQNLKIYLMNCEFALNNYVKIRFFSSRGKPTLTAEEFTEFLNQTQRDARLNEEIFPFLTPKRTLKLIDEIEPGQIELSYRGFLKFLLGEWSTDLDTTMQRTKIADMVHPICHYYVNSSHNTYLNGNQIHAAKALVTNRHTKAESDPEMYRSVRFYCLVYRSVL